ncbi:hypothetical protein C0J52_10353 [Blattella germanica]|nr:hypothetical protein C0J52_10353 [Blattella germanica]
MSGGAENNRYIVQVFVGALSQHYEALSVEASKQTTSEEIVSCIVERLSLADSPGGSYELAEVIGDSVGQECKERRLGPTESPVALMLLWPKILHSQQEYYSWGQRFQFHPIYNPKYVKLYQNRRLGPELPPHIFAVADAAYHCMLKERRNQCIVISGESGSGKTESTNFLLHHLTALSQKGSHGSGVEQTILSAGPVLEAFGNAKTAHNNNSSRFGKFIQVNYKENGMVHGAVVQKYLLEKSRICSQGRNERNYHVFYYLLAGASEMEKQLLHLQKTEDYHYLSKSGCYVLDNVDEKYEFSRLKQSMEMVGFTPEKQRRLFAVLSAVLLLGNVEFQPRKSAYHHDEAVGVKNPEVVLLISELLRVKQETLLQALTAKRARASGETLVINYRLPEAIAARDAMAKCLYGALFDWIVLQVNHALLSKKDTLRDHQGNSIGVLDIFGFEDFGLCNSFEQFCINYANEHLQYYFNQHVFKYEQEEYRKEGIRWTDIDFMDNTACLQLIEGKPNGLLCMLDDQCNFPGATNETLLQKFNSVHKDNNFYEIPQRREAAFIVRHYAGKVKYQAAEMREKNLDLMRQDIVGVLKNSSMAFVRELVGADPVAVFRWAIVRAFFRGYFAFHEAGRRHRQCRDGNKPSAIQSRYRNHTPNENLISFTPKPNSNVGGACRYPKQRNLNNNENQVVSHNHNRLSWPQFRIVNTSSSLQRNEFSVIREASASPACENINLDSARRDSLTRHPGALERVLCPDEAKVLERANQIKQEGIEEPADSEDFSGKNPELWQQQSATGEGTKAAPDCDGTVSAITAHSQADVRDFLLTLNLNRDNYQLGTSKIFLRESEKVKLDYRLHQQIMASIVAIQRWTRAVLERRRFLRLREATILIQSQWRMVMAQRYLTQCREGAKRIQRAWLSYKASEWYRKLRSGIVVFQAHVRGHLARRRFREAKLAREEEARHQASNIDAQSAQSTDEAFLSKESSQEELDERLDAEDRELQDSEEYVGTGQDRSSGIQEDSESEPILPDSTTAETVMRPPRSVPPPTVEKRVPRVNEVSKQTIGLEIYSKKKVSVKRSKGVKTESKANHKAYQEEKLSGSLEGGLGDTLTVTERKGSSDSLTSQKSSDSQGSAPVRDTLHKAKRQIQALIGKRPEKWDGGQTPQTHSDGEVDENIPPTTRSAPPITSTQSSDQFSGKPEHIVWKKRPDFTFDVSDVGSVTKLSLTDSMESQDSRLSSTSSAEVCVLASTVRRESRLSRQEASAGLLFAEQRSRTPLKSSLSHDERHSVRPPDPEVPVRIRRPRAPREVICRSVGEEMTDSSTLDPTFLGTIRESHISSDGSTAVDNRAPRSSDGSESSYGGRLSSSQEAEWSPDMDTSAYLKSGIQIHAVATKRSRSGAITTLTRRNSDPATNRAALITDQPSGIESPAKASDVLEWKGSTMFTIAGHRFRKVARFSKEDRYCKQLFHTKCIQNGGVLRLPCQHQHSGPSIRRNKRKTSRTQQDMVKPASSKFNLTGTSEFMDSTDKIISDATELQLMQDFITKKIYKIESEEGKKPSEVDRVFKQALREFKDNLVMETVCNQEQTGGDFPVTMGVNAFRGFMNEFMALTRLEEKPNKAKRKKEKKRKVEDPISYAGHTFLLTIINIPTACEICTSFFMWPIERGLVCQIPLHLLACGDGKVPIVVDRLITTIEMYGLYTEGIYRKSGVSSKVKELKARMEEGNIEAVNFENYQVHVLAAVLKSFFREMPEPLLTFDSYEDFLRAANLTDPQDRVSTLFTILKKLPKPNFDLMERLIFHLARVALHEDANRMNAGALAIVFAPCILRTNKIVPAQDSLHDIGRQTQCIETIVTEQLRKVRSTLADIDTLDTACHTATHRLSSLRSSKVFSPEELLSTDASCSDPKPALLNPDDEEALLMGHIQEIQKEKALLTSALPSLTRTTSDDDLLSTDMDDGSLDDVTGRLEDGDHERGHHGRKVRTTPGQKSLVSRSMSGGEGEPGGEDVGSKTSQARLKRQSSSDNSVVSLYPPTEVDCDEDPIMV